MPAAQSGWQRFSQSLPCPDALELVHVVHVAPCTPMPASAQASVMTDGRVLAGPVQWATTPGSAAGVTGPELDGAGLDGAGLDGAELDGAELAGVAVPAVAIGVADAGGGVGADACGVVGDVDDNAPGFAAAETAGVLEVPLLFDVHAVTARASPSTAPTAKFPMKRRIPCKTPGRPRWLPCATKSLRFYSPADATKGHPPDFTYSTTT